MTKDDVIRMADLVGYDVDDDDDVYAPASGRYGIDPRLEHFAQLVPEHTLQYKCRNVSTKSQNVNTSEECVHESDKSIHEKTHTNHPMRHWDRTCPACVEEQEPVAWVKEGKVRVGFGRIEERKCVHFDQTLPVGTKLYAAPVSKREWVSLTDQQTYKVWNSQGSDFMDQDEAMKFARDIEAASKELNT